ncbi:hypothetical protein PSTG_05927 [Puccinia striiformis f. sp. tritici PST-78]|uniref:Uncharacterized protein n=1 Tax=Puccinia striiformis f. sp. tritici PST-78 TaxID=1165861 RepID=A0A0L0VNK3_9BASI|nr:hypothetical protein PSTG_05927 [Puccinia striiformis f. sp. tritici PST-78]
MDEIENEMADAKIKPADELEHQRLDEQGDLVIQGFSKLIEKYIGPIDLTHNRASLAETMLSLSKDEDGLKDMAIDQLQSTLPQLKHHLATVSQLLNPSSLHQDTELKFKRVLLVQPDLESTMEQIGSSINLVCPQPTSARERTDDQHLQRLKSYRLHSLRTAFLAACPEICQSLRSATELVEQAKLALPTGKFKPRRPDGMACGIDDAVLLIESAIGSIERSDWQFALRDWESELEGINDELEEILPPEPRTDDESEISQCEPVVRLAELTIPLLKLSRLFFNKLTLRGINTKRLPFFTEMCSAQIESLAKAHREVASSLFNISCNLAWEPVEAGWNQEAMSYTAFIKWAENLKTSFEAPFILALLHLIPFIPDTDGFPTQNYYRNWFKTWKTLLILATENFINFARSVGSDTA